MELYEKINYNANINFLISSYIREYDISKANINVLFRSKVINEEQYKYYYNLDRNSRQIQIGLLLRDNPHLNKVLQDGIQDAKRLFFQSNKIKDEEVLCIKNDAIFLINKIPQYTKFDNIEFMQKNVYTSFYKFGPITLYYFSDPINDIENIDVKGIKGDSLMLHKDYFLEFLEVCFNSAQRESLQSTLDIVITFYNKYVALNLDVGYYREFNPDSQYLLKPISKYRVFKSDALSNDDKRSIDISCNMTIIRTLYQYYSSLHLNHF